MVGAPASIVAAHAERWLAAVDARWSRRSYTGELVTPEDLAALTALADEFRPWAGASAHVIAEAPASLFFGILGSYGGISNSPSAFAFAGARDARPEAVGYTGEALVLEATARGLDTCWVAGLFRPAVGERLLALPGSERLFAISALGTARDESTVKEGVIRGSARATHRRPLDETAPGHERWPAWARAGVTAAQTAPSAMNRQPWRFSMADGTLELAYAGADTPRTSKRLDCGIAMLHVELGALSEGVAGAWELLPGAVVARFVPSVAE